jgi:SAM-dependent methyltransferase
MHYDPIKQSLGRFFNRSAFLRLVFYRLLDVLLLRTWHIHRALRRFAGQHGGHRKLQVLDAGSGFGQYTHYMARKHPHWSVYAVDLKPDEINACRLFFRKVGLANARFGVEDLTGFEDPGAFHLILSVDVMEHIEEDEQVFRNFHASLKKGGMLLISTPSDRGGSGVKSESDRSFIEEHVRDGYGAGEISDKLKKAGFSRVETYYTYGVPGSISWHLSMKIPISLIGVSRLFILLLPFYFMLTMPFALLLNLADLYIRHRSGTGLLVKAWK